MNTHNPISITLSAIRTDQNRHMSSNRVLNNVRAIEFTKYILML